MKPRPFSYARPATLEDAVALLAAGEGEAKAIAGGQSLMPMLAFRVATPKLLVDIGRIPGLNRIEIDATGVRLGALVRWCDVERHPALAKAHPLLVAAIRHVAHYQIRNRGTIGGSLAHADPAAELPGIAVTCDAEITAIGRKGRRTIAATDFFTGTLTTTLDYDELILEVRLPAWRVSRYWAFEEFARRRGDFALAGVALFYDLDATGRICEPHVGAIGVADRPIRLAEVERLIAGRVPDERLAHEVAACAAETVDPQDDIHAPAAYRRALLGVLTRRALVSAADWSRGVQA